MAYWRPMGLLLYFYTLLYTLFHFYSLQHLRSISILCWPKNGQQTCDMI
jgi:hypothetical protein